MKFLSGIFVLLCLFASNGYAKHSDKGAELNAELLYSQIYLGAHSGLIKSYINAGMDAEFARIISNFALARTDLLVGKKKVMKCLFENGISGGKIENRSELYDTCLDVFIANATIEPLEKLDYTENKFESLSATFVFNLPADGIVKMDQRGYDATDAKTAAMVAFTRLDTKQCTKEVFECFKKNGEDTEIAFCIKNCKEKYFKLLTDVSTDYSLKPHY